MFYKYIPSCNKKLLIFLFLHKKRCVVVLIRSTEVLLMSMVSITCFQGEENHFPDTISYLEL